MYPIKHLPLLLLPLLVACYTYDPQLAVRERQARQARIERADMRPEPIEGADSVPWAQVKPICRARERRQADEINRDASNRIYNAVGAAPPIFSAEAAAEEKRRIVLDAQEAMWSEWLGCLAEYGWTMR